MDDAHGFGTMGKTGAGTGEEQGVQDQIDLYFSTFAKSWPASAHLSPGTRRIIKYLRYSVRSQIYAKCFAYGPWWLGGMKRLELLKTNPSSKTNLWNIVKAMQEGLT